MMEGGLLSNLEKALALSRLGFHVFPARSTPSEITDPKTGKTRVLSAKSPLTAHGFRDATQNPDQIKKWWTENPDAYVAYWTGASGVVVLDLDVKKDETGAVVKDGFSSLEWEFLYPEETWTYSTENDGAHFVYLAPEGDELSPDTDYRKMPGVDRRSGGSYAIWYTDDVPDSREAFAPVPEWLCDNTAVRTVAAFEGSVKDWYDSLVPGEPNALVRKALKELEKVEDMSHAEMVSAQTHAIRLGAEGNPGVEKLLARIEEIWLNRDPALHTTPESEWEFKFVEALESGIARFGDHSDLLKSLPKYSIEIVPEGVPERLLTEPRGKTGFSELLASLINHTSDDLLVTAILWGCPATREQSLDWGLEFVHKRVAEARQDAARPTTFREAQAAVPSLLTLDEIEAVRARPTFIDLYLDYSREKGWCIYEYAMPAAWMLLSMAFGMKAIVPMSKTFGVNLWFLVMGESTTGKTVHEHEVRTVLSLLLDGGDTAPNLGANSSPEAMHETLIERDGKPSMIHHDEAADFFSNLKNRDWMRSLEQLMSRWYEGFVDPQQKVRLKELRGKSAQTSLNVLMWGTPDRMMDNLDHSMFQSGFLARWNWNFGPPAKKGDPARYKFTRREVNDRAINPRAYDLVIDLWAATDWLPEGKRIAMDWTPEAANRVSQAFREMDEFAQSQDHYDVTQPSIGRLGGETVWKCAALLALYRGETVIRVEDVLIALYYAQTWFENIFRAVASTGENEFNRQANQIEEYIASLSAGAPRHKIIQRFRRVIKRDPKEIDSLLEFLKETNRIYTTEDGGKRVYRVVEAA